MVQIEWKWNHRQWRFRRVNNWVQGLLYQWELCLGPLHIHKWRLPALEEE